MAVASPCNFDYLQSDAVGVTYCVDRYAAPDDIRRQIHRITHEEDGKGVQYVLDCVGSTTATLCFEMVQLENGARSEKAVHPVEMICLAGNPNVASPGNSTPALCSTRPVTVHRISFSTTFYGDDIFAQAVMEDLSILLLSQGLHPARPEVMEHGLAGVRCVRYTQEFIQHSSVSFYQTDVALNYFEINERLERKSWLYVSRIPHMPI